MVFQPAHSEFSTSMVGRPTPSPACRCTASLRRLVRLFICSTARKLRNNGQTSSKFMTSTNSSKKQSSRDMSMSWNTLIETVPRRRRFGIFLRIAASCSMARPAWSRLSSVIWSRTTFWNSAKLQLKGSVMMWEATKRLVSFGPLDWVPSSSREILKSGGATKPGPQRGSKPRGATARWSLASPGNALWTDTSVSVVKALSRQTSFKQRTRGMRKSGCRWQATAVMLRVTLSTCLKLAGFSRNSSSSASDRATTFLCRIWSRESRSPRHFSRI
mmetsp:Transcript_31624/g.98391  ORF Transcript_31624/g.98391 Transcript_31624/m.98391 type:complete len:273 (+) Transcript_31624:628-1446(+)